MLRIIRFSEAKIENFIAMSVEHLLNKDILIYPTDTSYGVGTLFNDQSIDKLNLLKSRPSGKYYSAIVPNIEWIKENLEVNTIQLNILNKYLRGEYTFILNVKYSKKTLGIRIPDYDLVNRIASKIGEPFTATSANISGKGDSYSLVDLKNGILKSKIINKFNILVVDNGQLSINKKSTVVDLTNPKPIILRQGSGKFPK